MSRSLPKCLALESLEARRLFAFSDYAQLINQDDAITNFPNVTGEGVTVAVIDSGIDYTLPQFGGAMGEGFKVIGGHDFIDGDDDPRDTSGHGTAVGAAIAGDPWTVGGVEYQGIAPDAKLVALRVFGTFGGSPATVIEAALQWVIEHRDEFDISIVNMSLGDDTKFNETRRDLMSDELKTLAQMGVFVAVSSGNENDGLEPPIHQDGISMPAADANAFSVGAVDGNDVLADFGQRGPELDVLAPGVNIVLPQPGGFFEAIDGTSFASPMVAGTAALIRQLDPTATPNDIGSIIMSSGAVNLDGDDEVGGTSGLLYSRLDVDAAVKLARQRIGKYAALDFGTRFDTALDSQNVLHAAWYDEATGDLLYSARDASGLWSNVYRIDGDGAPGGADVGANLSIAVDTTGHVGVAYFDSAITAVKYATLPRDPSNGWITRTIESDKHVGLTPSLGYDLQGHAYIAYYRRSGGDLKLARVNRETAVISREFVDTGTGGADVGLGCSLDVGEAAFTVPDGFTVFNTTIAIAYADSTNGDLRYARLNIDEPDDDAWFLSLVDDTGGVAQINLSLHAGTTIPGLQAQIAYQDMASADVRYAFRNVDWFIETVASAGRLGYNVQMFFGAGNVPKIVYSNEVKQALFTAERTGTNAWTSRRTTPSVGPHSVASNKRTGSVLFSWLEADGADVLTQRLI